MLVYQRVIGVALKTWKDECVFPRIVSPFGLRQLQRSSLVLITSLISCILACFVDRGPHGIGRLEVG